MFEMQKEQASFKTTTKSTTPSKMMSICTLITLIAAGVALVTGQQLADGLSMWGVVLARMRPA